VFELQQEGGPERVSTTALSARLGVRKASVTGMLQKLAGMRPRLVRYERYRGARLTPAGERAALQIVRHHRLIESYLSQRLGYGWDEVHGEADRLEHVISEDLEERMAAQLGYPQVDPHGEPIPGRDGLLPARSEVRLSQLQPGTAGFISRVSDDEPELLRYLSQIGLNLNARVEVTERGPFDGPLQVKVSGRPGATSLSRAVTDRVFVSTGTRVDARQAVR
jgi:DtxR family Mn-dependent transcriptional regulator